MLRATSTIAANLVDPGVQHLTLHQITGKRAGDAEAEQSHPHQNSEFGGNRQIVQLHSKVSGSAYAGARLAGEFDSQYGKNPLELSYEGPSADAISRLN